ncbi:glycosyltransferase family 4 protein [Paenibacillus ihbetae]|uniref:Glycosyl transferase family 1 n=1 Tax=Paenibacillus ihbetae TaxID=1870820 RepID=A0ABX3JSH9_9BACL|nr:glycosyltransferase family 4 protein [Paenibacillus ihbetae]OOC58373.1 glycosyl transferase family 1 [Paenibacillus ihbetae]
MPMVLKPKMLIFTHVCNPTSITGAEKLLLFFCQQISPYFECVLVAPNEGRLTTLARASGHDVRIYKVPLLHGIYTPGPGLLAEADRLVSTSVFRSFVQWIAGESPSVIVTNTCVHLLPAVAGKKLGIPVLWQLTEMITNNGYAHLSASLINQYSSWIISISESVAQHFPVDVRQSKMTILPPSWNDFDIHPETWPEHRASFRSRLGIGPDIPVIGMISSFLIETKGVHHFIDMALSLKDAYPKALFLIVGSVMDPGYEKQCRERIEAAGAKSRFIFAGAQEDMGQVYPALDIVVVPSLVPEGFGLTALEGLLYGKPVVAYAAGGLAEMLTAVGCPQMLAEPSSPASLADKVTAVLEQSDQGEALGQQNRAQVVSVYGPELYRARVNGMVTRWMTEQPSWFQINKSIQFRHLLPGSRHKGRGRKRKKRGLSFPRQRTARRSRGLELRKARRRAIKSRLRRTSVRRRRA